jgi:hypothetical protein
MRTYAPGGARPTILDDGTAATAVVELRDGNLLAGFDTSSIGINILGAGVDDLIVRDVATGGLGNGMAIIGGTNIDVTDFEYRRASPLSTGFGLRLVNVTTARLDQLMFENIGNGAWIVGSSGIDISNVDSTNNAIGVNIVSSSDVTVDEVTASYSLPITSAFTIGAVAVSRDGLAGAVPSGIDISDVTFTAAMPFATMRAVGIFDATDVSVTRLQATNVHSGVLLSGTSNATVTDLTVTNALGAAANIVSSGNVTLTGLDASNVLTGLFLSSATNLSATDIDVAGVGSVGAFVFNSTNVAVADFTAVGLGIAPGSFRHGIDLSNSSNVSFTNANVSQFHRGIFASGGGAHALTDVTLDDVDVGAIVNGVNGFALTNATMTDVQIGMTVASGGGSVSRNVALTDIDITGRAGIVGASPGIQMLGVDGATLTRITVDSLAWGVRFFGSPSSVVQNVTASDVTVTNFNQSALQTVDASNITVDGFTISDGVGSGIQIVQASNNVAFRNGSIGDVSGMGIQITGTGAVGAALSNIDISGVATRAGVFHSGAGVSLENNLVASFNQIDIDGTNSGGASVGVYGFDFIDRLGNTQTVNGMGNTAVNVTNVCGRNGLGTVSGTIQVNGNPEPGTSC